MSYYRYETEVDGAECVIFIDTESRIFRIKLEDNPEVIEPNIDFRKAHDKVKSLIKGFPLSQAIEQGVVTECTEDECNDRTIGVQMS